MGWPFETASWDGVEGAIYMGANEGSSMPMFWLIVSIALCVIALIGGIVHEKSSYRKLER